MISPALLRKGDRIGVIAPARKISREEIALAVDLLKNWGLEVVFGKNMFGEQHQFSGSDEARTADLQQMLDDPSVKAVISARGGYGTLRIIDKIDFSGFRKNPKWIIGFSDITVLHAHVHNFGIETLHAPMLINFFQNAEATESIRKILFGENGQGTDSFGKDSRLSEFIYTAESHPLNRKGSGEGELTGGNLSLLYALTGSSSEIRTQGKVLFLEDLDEYLYHVDRMMMQLKRAGRLSGLAGLVVGGMTEMKDNTVPFGKNAEDIIAEHVKEFSYPVCFNFPAGHIRKNLALPLGRRAKLSVKENSVLRF